MMRAFGNMVVVTLVVGSGLAQDQHEERAVELPGLDAIIERVQVKVGKLVFDGLAAGPKNGELVILLHGFPQTSYSWRHQIAALAKAGYRAFAPDQRGYSPGARPEGVDAYHVDNLVADVLYAFCDPRISYS